MTEEKITFTQHYLEKGYSSHGYLSTFGEIAELERDRENEPFSSYTEDAIAEVAHYEAIWVTRDPMNAFRYAISASEWELSEDELIARYPHWREDIVEIDCQYLFELEGSDDGDDGCLMVDVSGHLKNLSPVRTSTVIPEQASEM